MQAAGRTLRLAPGKTRGYILLPLVVPDGATLDEVTATSAFKFVLFVLRALSAHDERIIEWFRATAEGRIFLAARCYPFLEKAARSAPRKGPLLPRSLTDMTAAFSELQRACPDS